MEKALRVLFLWRTEVEEQREFAADMRQRNEALVYNILPQHVAAHFLRQRTRQHEELYADSFAEVGVLFASMPNFSGQYSITLPEARARLCVDVQRLADESPRVWLLQSSTRRRASTTRAWSACGSSTRSSPTSTR